MAYIKGFIWFFTTAFEGGIVLFHRQEVRDQGPTTSYKWYVNIIIGTCSVVKESTVQETKETRVQSLGWKDPLEKGMATHSSILAWRIPWAEEPGGLQSIGLQSWTRLKWLGSSSSSRYESVLVTQSYPSLCDPMDYSLPDSSVHWIFQARILEWVAISFSITGV